MPPTGRPYDQAGVPYDRAGMTYDGPATVSDYIVDAGSCLITLIGRGRRKVVTIGSGGDTIHIGPLADIGPSVPEDLEFIIRDSGTCSMNLIPSGFGFVWAEFITPEEEEELVLLGLL